LQLKDLSPPFSKIFLDFKIKKYAFFILKNNFLIQNLVMTCQMGQHGNSLTHPLLDLSFKLNQMKVDLM